MKFGGGIIAREAYELAHSYDYRAVGERVQVLECLPATLPA